MNVFNPQTKTLKTIVRSGVRRPNWICSIVLQIVFFIRDASGSMIGQRAEHAWAASCNLVSELALPQNKDGFYVCIVDFSGRAKVIQKLTKASALDGKVKPLNFSLFSGSTNITAGIKQTLRAIENANGCGEKDVKFLRPVAILYSDGGHNEGPEPNKAADQLKAVADLVTVAFGENTDEDLLRDLASTPQHFYRCTSGRELRSFLASVGDTMTATMAAGTNATQALTQVQQ